MNAHKKLILVVAALLATGRLAAHEAMVGTPHVPPHEHPQFVTVKTTMDFDDGTKVESSPVPGEPGKYFVTITQVVGSQPKVYSLLTLGLQRIRGATMVKRIGGSGGTVLHYQHNNPNGTPWQAGRMINETGLDSSNTHLDADKIEFVSFTGPSCQFQVIITPGAALGVTRWAGVPSTRAGHDNTPPDGYPPQ